MTKKAIPACISCWLPGFEPDDVPASAAGITALEPPVTPEAAPVVLAPADAPCPAVPAVQSWRFSSIEPNPIVVRQIFPRLRPANLEGLASAKAKFDANVRAIETLSAIETEGRQATADERVAMARYCGWGSLAAAFNLDGKEPAWTARARQLQALLDEADYESARASVNNSHFTPLSVIDALWAAVSRLGFTGGRVLEPAAGVGHFIGAMPEDLAARCQVSAVEIDRISGRLLSALYAPAGAAVHVQPFEKSAFPDSWFDLVIGNVPFGDYKVADMSNRPYAGFSIHNYFIARALDLVRPGGLVVLITSAHTLESYSKSVRRHLASQARLLGAIRLPKGAFAESAGTEVQTDVLFLRRREKLEAVEDGWIERLQAPDELTGCPQRRTYMPVNEWYARHPEWMIGRLRMESNGYEEMPTAVYDGSIESALDERVTLLPEGDYRPAAAATVAQAPAITPAEPGARPGTFRVRNGRLHRVQDGGLTDVHEQFNATQRARIAGMCAIRDHARALLDMQLAEDGDENLHHARAMLGGTYDQYVSKYGYLSTRANALAFRRDPDYPLLLSLEYYDEETETARKAALFTQRTLRRVTEPTVADEPAAALAACMQWRGKVDPAYMASLLSAPQEAVTAALAEAGHIFLDPFDESWKTSDEYLSGNVKVKLDQARMGGDAYRSNVQALEKIQPEDLPPASIEVRLGAVWIPAADVEAFVQEVLEIKDCTVRYSGEAGAWSVGYSEWQVRQNVKATQEFGTSRMHAVQLLLCALNVQTPTVKDPVSGTTTYVVNSEQTLAAREKLGLLKDRFAAWAFEDMARRERLCALYNRLFNATRARTFDGSHLTLPGFSHCYELHPQQPNAVWRIVQSGNTGLFHTVGAGKTAVCVIASMELRRLGFAAKPCHVVPNHMLQSYTAEFVRLYPQASVLMASKEDLEGDRRRELVSRIATGDWDAVVITHASFERIKASPEFTRGYIKEIIHDIELAASAAQSEDRSNRIVKQLEKMKKSWAVRLEKLSAQGKKDDLLTWEQLGIDWLFIDEAHLFKNLFRFSKMRVAGLPMASSERAFDLYVKTRYTMQLHGNRQRGVVFATATPVANTMAEIHTMQRYLQPARLAELGLQQFDAWAATFGEAVTALEIAPDGSGYRMHTRFARFINVPELMSIFGEVADIQTAEMLKLPVPKLRGGKARIMASPPSPQLKAFVQTLVERATEIRNGHVKPDEDNMLAVTNDGRKAALDFRLIDPRARFDAGGKIAACVREVHAIWQRTAPLRGAQLVFCDLSSPKGGKMFSVYDDLRMRLIDAGIPEQEIAFIHDAPTDAQKAKLFKNVREGRVRVLLGSTQKMGIGTNVQDRLVAQHDLDAPWRPCDVEQREGRILRQGNTNEEVEIFRYVTEGSFDAYMWQTLETKARFIAQVMRGDRALRSVEDVALATLSYAEIKALASGNPLVIEKAGVDAEVAKLSTLHWIWRNQRYTNERDVAELPLTIAAQEKKLAAHEADLARLEPQTMGSITVEIGKRQIVGADAVGEALRAQVLAVKEEVGRMSGRGVERLIGRFGGFDLGIACPNREQVPALYLVGKAVYNATPYQMGPALVAGLLVTLDFVREEADKARTLVQARRKRLTDLQVELGRPFEHAGRLTTLQARQAELIELLDLRKNEAGSHKADADTDAAFAVA
jgi:N12 class adenine-specific DNA methylase